MLQTTGTERNPITKPKQTRRTTYFVASFIASRTLLWMGAAGDVAASFEGTGAFTLHLTDISTPLRPNDVACCSDMEELGNPWSRAGDGAYAGSLKPGLPKLPRDIMDVISTSGTATQ